MLNNFLFLGFTSFLFFLNLIALRHGRIYLYLLLGAYTILMNIFVLKQYTLFGFQTAGGNGIYGAVFLLTNILVEHYGPKEGRRAVLIGFLSSIFFVISTQILLKYQANSFDFAHEHLSALFSLMPRVLIASILVYALAQFCDVLIFQKIRQVTQGKYLYLRNNISTMIAQLIDTISFTALGMVSWPFLPQIPGYIEPSQFWEIVWIAYFIKCGVALLDTPFMYLSYYFKPRDEK
ncbi:MAG TPA: queuosine precursor transporter [Candidatus Gracilibacteria bacterium]|nr:queuosine precursor transporter [Candidatus Gracilibacteria bacterium]